jgi:hypothetical protein
MVCADEEHFSDHVERRLHRLVVGTRARGHHRQSSLLGAADAAAHRAVDLHDVVLRQQAVNFGRHLRADRGEIDEAPDALALDHATGAGRDVQ